MSQLLRIAVRFEDIGGQELAQAGTVGDLSASRYAKPGERVGLAVGIPRAPAISSDFLVRQQWPIRAIQGVSL